MKKLIFILFALMVYSNAYSQILNIELSRINQDTSGFAGNLNADIKIVQNKYKTTTFSSMLHLQRKWNKHLIMALSNISLTGSEGKDLENSGFQHLRYNYEITELLTWEGFTQVQYNKITGIDQRFLLGTGPRFEIIRKDKNQFGIATAYMYEFEEYADTTFIARDHRASSYIAWRNSSIKNLSFITTLYYQPLLNQIDDYRINWAGKLTYKLTNKIAFYTYWGITYDTHPPIGIEKTLYSIKNGIEISL